MPVDGPSYFVGRTDKIVLTMFYSGTNYRTIDACGQALTIFPSFVASGTKIPYVECTKYLRSTLLPFSDYTTHTSEPWPKLLVTGWSYLFIGEYSIY